MRRDRILFLSHTAALGGAERSLCDLAEGLRDRAEVILLAEGPLQQQLRDRGVTVRVEPLGALGAVRRESPLPALGALADLARLARRIAPDLRRAAVLHANSQKSFMVGAAAGLVARRPVVWHLRDLLVPAHFSPMNIRAATTLANLRAARVITNSQATAAAFVAAGGKAELTRVVHNGISAAPFDAVTEAECQELRRALGVGRGYVVSVLGRLTPWKGQHIVLEAIAQVPDVQLLVIGAALFGEVVYAEALRARAAELGVSARVHFLGEREDVPRLLRLSDAIVHSSVAPEPFGRVIVEAMLARRPIIATATGGVPEIIASGVTGWLVAPGDVGALVAALRSVRADPATSARVVTQARAEAEARFTVRAMSDGVRRVLDEVITGASDR